MLYSKSTGGFYDRAIHGADIPQDVVEVEGSDYAAMMAGQARGRVIVPDENGYPMSQEPPPAAVTAKDLYRNRDRLLAETDWYVTRHAEQIALKISTSLAQEEYLQLLLYRQGLRDLPGQEAFPDGAVLPDMPPFLLETA